MDQKVAGSSPARRPEDGCVSLLNGEGTQPKYFLIDSVRGDCRRIGPLWSASFSCAYCRYWDQSRIIALLPDLEYVIVDR